MNPWYTLMESEHRWLYLSVIVFGAGCIGAIAVVGYGWSHTLARIWFYAALLVTIGLLFKAYAEWRNPPARDVYAGPRKEREGTVREQQSGKRGAK